jgi:hypothetical protein
MDFIYFIAVYLAGIFTVLVYAIALVVVDDFKRYKRKGFTTYMAIKLAIKNI